MKQKLDTDGKPVIDDSGDPIFIDESGQEVAVNVGKLFKKVPELGQENARRRHAEKEKEEKISELEQMIADIKTSSVPKDEISTAKKQLAEQYANQIAELKNVAQIRKSENENLKLSNLFGNSAIIKKTTFKDLPEVALSYFGKNFKFEEIDGKSQLVGYFDNGTKIMSKSEPYNTANFEDALTQIIDKYPKRQSIMIGTQAGAGGLEGQGSKQVGDPGAMDYDEYKKWRMKKDG